MRFLLGLVFAVSGALLDVAAKQVSRDSVRPKPVGYSSLLGRVTPTGSRLAGAGCLLLAALWWFA